MRSCKKCVHIFCREYPSEKTGKSDHFFADMAERSFVEICLSMLYTYLSFVLYTNPTDKNIFLLCILNGYISASTCSYPKSCHIIDIINIINLLANGQIAIPCDCTLVIRIIFLQLQHFGNLNKVRLYTFLLRTLLPPFRC